jgi:hypothetical protein
MELTQLIWGVRILGWVTLLFPLVNAAFWPWWKTGWGWNLITFDMGVFISILPSWLGVTFGIRDNMSVYWIEIIGVDLVILNVVWRTYIIIRTQVRGRNHDSASRVRRGVSSENGA